MKYKYLLITALLILGAVFVSCGNKESAGEQSEFNFLAGFENINEDTSYAMGITIGADVLNYIISSGIIPYLDDFMLGFNDVMLGRETRMELYEAYDIFNAEVSAMMDEQTEYFRQQEIEFLAENAKKEGVIITSSGLQYQVLREGTGPKPSASSTVVVDYEGSLINGTIFDSSYERGYPYQTPVDEVISGWTEGLQLMSAGSQYLFFIPSNLAYGSSGVSSIPPYSTLIFTVELHEIIN